MEAKWGTSEGREEEVGMPSPRTSSDSHQVSTILEVLERERMVPTMRNPSAVAPKKLMRPTPTSDFGWKKKRLLSRFIKGEKCLESLSPLP